MSVLVKICGITSVAEALLAAEAGADALGMIGVESSPRYVAPEVVRQIVAAVGPFVPVVSVVRRADQAHRVGESVIQFYEGPMPQERVGIPVVRVQTAASLERLADFPHAPAVLLDTYHEKALGGLGQTFDWSLAVEAKTRWERPLILAGGLRPENVAEAVRTVRPYAVDVASGVESVPGKKDPGRLRAFIAAAKGA